MSSLIQKFQSAACAAGHKVAYAWDWPLVPENNYSETDRDRHKSLRQNFVAVASTTGAAACIVLQLYSPSIIIPATIAAIAGAHYMAGVVSEKRRTRSRSEPNLD